MLTPSGVAGSSVDVQPSRPLLEIEVLGRFSLRHGGRPIRLNNRKTQAVLACLALQDGGEMLRERLVGLVWSEAEEDKARASLRQALHELKEAFAAVGYKGLTADRVRVMLDRDTVSVDLVSALESARQASVHPALLGQLQPLDELLRSLESVDPAFESWITAKRKTYEEQIVAQLERSLGLGDLDNDRREGLARALVNLDPTNEIAVRNLMAARLALGDSAGAMQAYKSLWNLLDDEFDTEPAKATQELFAAVKSMPTAPAASGLQAVEPASPAASPAAMPRVQPRPVAGSEARLLISVAAIDAVGVRPEHRYLVDGFRRDLLSCLVRFREWLVRDGAGEVADSASYQEYVVEIGGYDSDGAVRLVLMLRDRPSGIYLWTERIMLTTATWFETQQVIVRRLAAVLNVHVSSGRLEALSQAPEADTLAYDIWLRAQSETASWEKTGWENAIALLTELTSRHPRFAPAFSNLAQLFNSEHFIQPGRWRTQERAKQATHLASEAVRLDPVDSRGHLALGWAHAMAGRHDRAAIHHEMACELNDNDPWTLMSAGLGAATRGEHELARSLGARAFELSITPSAPQWLYHAQIAFLRGDYETTVRVDSSAWEGVRYAPGWRIAALGQMGRASLAAEQMDAYIERLRDVWSGEEPIDRDRVARWFLQAFPFCREADWAKLRDGLAQTGADLGGARFLEWPEP